MSGLINPYYSKGAYQANGFTHTMFIAPGVAAIEDDEYFKDTVTRVINTRKWASEEFVKLGFNVYESSTNFLFVSHKDKSAKEIFE